MVRGVECFEAELKTLSFGDGEVLDRRKIEVPYRRTRQNVAPDVAELSGLHIREGSQIEPLVGALLVRRQIRIDDRRVEPVLVPHDDLSGRVPPGPCVERA